MASHHSAVPINDADSAAADSLASTPRSDLHDDLAAHAMQPRVRFMCSFGGKILPRPTDNQLRYVGGDTRMVAVHRHATSYAALLSKLSKLAGTTNISIKYQLPSEDLDALITVTGDEDVENMMEEYDRLGAGAGGKSARLRLFLFPGDAAGADDLRATSINSLLDGSAKRQNWFFDALNGGPGSGPVLERGRSEVSSIVSEVPDYLFGLDNSDDPSRDPAKIKNKNLVNDNVSMSDPGSPAPIASSPFCSAASALTPAIPDLPPVKTRPVTEAQSGYSGSPIWQYPNPDVQPVPTAVYYVHQPAPNTSVQPAPIRAQFLQPYSMGPVQLPIGFNQLYAPPGVRPYDMTARISAENVNPPAVYYGAPNVGIIPGSGMEEIQGSGPDLVPGRVVQGS